MRSSLLFPYGLHLRRIPSGSLVECPNQDEDQSRSVSSDGTGYRVGRLILMTMVET